MACTLKNKNYCCWCNQALISTKSSSSSSNNKRAEIQHYEWVADYIEKSIPGEITVVNFILEYLFTVQYENQGYRPFIIQNHEKQFHLKCITLSFSTKSGRISKPPKRFEDLSFVKGSGVYGCDRFDQGYDDGNFIDYEEFSSDLKRKKDEDFIVEENFEEEITLEDEQECDYSSSSEEEWDEDEYLTDD